MHAGVTSGDRAFLKERAGLDIRPVDRVLASMDDMHAWVRGQAGDRFDRMPGRMLGIEATFVQARRDGVTRLEAGEDVWAITLHDGSAQAVWAMLQAAHARGGPGVEWIPQLGLSRHCPVSALERWLAPFLELGVFRTLDLSGDELARPVGEFAPLYRRAKAAGLRLKAHVGEWGTADDVWRAVELLELDEVQHGIAAAASPAAMRFLAQSGVQLNVCPTSNVKLGRVARMEEHPIRLAVRRRCPGNRRLRRPAGVRDEPVRGVPRAVRRRRDDAGGTGRGAPAGAGRAGVNGGVGSLPATPPA